MITIMVIIGVIKVSRDPQNGLHNIRDLSQLLAPGGYSREGMSESGLSVSKEYIGRTQTYKQINYNKII